MPSGSRVIVHINWGRRYEITEVIRNDGGIFASKGVYMLFTEQQLLYVGKTWDQEFKDRIRQHARTFVTRAPHVKVGEVKWQSLDRLHARRVDDVEHLLIFRAQPRENVQGKSSYLGRAGLRVMNFGDYDSVQLEYQD